jgi:hypothetical protein
MLSRLDPIEVEGEQHHPDNEGQDERLHQPIPQSCALAPHGRRTILTRMAPLRMPQSTPCVRQIRPRDRRATQVQVAHCVQAGQGGSISG